MSSIIDVEENPENPENPHKGHEENPENPETPHKGQKISKIAVSPKGDYVVTYSEDDKSIVGWNITVKEDPVEKVYDSLDATLEDVFNMKVSNRDSKVVVVICKALFPQGMLIYKLYKFGNFQIDFKHKSYNENDISFTMNGKLVYCLKNKIQVYYLDNINIKNKKLKLESVYEILIDDVIRECGITENKIWTRTPYFLYLWNLNTSDLNDSYCLPECNYDIIDSSTRVLIRDTHIKQEFIFLSGYNFPIRNGNFSEKNRDYFLVEDIFDKNNQSPVEVNFYFKANKVYIEEYEEDDNKTISDGKFKQQKYRPIKDNESFSICNLQSNKVYGVDGNKIKADDISKYEWVKPNFKDDKNSEWSNYLKAWVNGRNKTKNEYKKSAWSSYLEAWNEDDINDTIINPDIKGIWQLLNDKDSTDNTTKYLEFDNKLYRWKVEYKEPTITIEIISPTNSSTKVIDSKQISYKLIKCTLLKNNALALKVKRKVKKKINPKEEEDSKPKEKEDSKPKEKEDSKPKEKDDSNPKEKEDSNSEFDEVDLACPKEKEDREILAIFKYYRNKIQLQYFTHLKNDYFTYLKNDDGNKNDDEENKINVDDDVNENKNVENKKNVVENESDDDIENESNEDVENELPFGDIDDIESIIKNDDGSLEKEWLKFITTDYFTLLKYGSKYFRFFIKFKKVDLIDSIYKRCIVLIKTDTKNNFNFLKVINSSIRILIKKYPYYLSEFTRDMLILLYPTKVNPLINSNYHVYSDYKITSCWKLPLRYYYFKYYFLLIVSWVLSISYIFYCLPTYLLEFGPFLPLIPLFIVLALVAAVVSCCSCCDIEYIIIPFIFFAFLIYIIISLPYYISAFLFIYFPIIIYGYYKSTSSYDQSIYLTCAYNSLCYYPSKYSSFHELVFVPESSIFIKICHRGSDYEGFKWIKRRIKDFKKETKKFGKKMWGDDASKSKIKQFLQLSGNMSPNNFLKTPQKIIHHSNNSNEKNDDLDDRREFFDNLNGEAIIDFKWRTFGIYYYYLIWLIFTIFQCCFIIGSYPSSFITSETRTQLYKTTYIIGFIQLYFEFKQFIWGPKKYIFSIWNWFDLSAYLFPIITSYLWVHHNNDIPNWSIPLSCLFLNLKFLLFLRAFEYFGVHFAIIFGVMRRIFPFLVILIFTVASFALSFHLLLIPKDLNPLLNPNPDDPNNPWTLSQKYNQISEDGSINLESILIVEPDESTNLFTSFYTSLLATYLFLTGDSSSLTKWSPTADNALIMILMSLFSFFIVIYLMNLFIGILNISIEKDYDRATFLVQKAKILAEIELFYLLPFQRRWKRWFPDVIHYKVRKDIARKFVKKVIEDGVWKLDDCSEYKNEILSKLDL